MTRQSINTNGTCLQGQITADYAELVRAFGPPMVGDDDKTDAEWAAQVNGTVATIYNWKDGPSFCGPDGTPVEQITQWNIGGRSHEAVELVERRLGRLA